jgi:shikimate dehydrogenase
VRVVEGDNVRAALAEADLVVNTTPVGMWPHTDVRPPVDPEWLSPRSLVYDIINNPPRTALIRAAEARGCRALGGLGMLVMQGALAFRLWTGREAPVQVMRQAAEAAVANWK